MIVSNKQMMQTHLMKAKMILKHINDKYFATVRKEVSCTIKVHKFGIFHVSTQLTNVHFLPHKLVSALSRNTFYTDIICD